MTLFTDHIGVSEEVIKRAALILDTIENENHIERLCSERILTQDQNYKVSVLPVSVLCSYKFQLFLPQLLGLIKNLTRRMLYRN